jgi:hypothetical protein
MHILQRLADIAQFNCAKVMAYRSASLVFAAALCVGASLGTAVIWAERSGAAIASAQSLPDEGETGLYEPVSFAKMNKVVAICDGC